jgi:predicted RNA binding protein YcfA (HicA-like mRNA interferase family)
MANWSDLEKYLKRHNWRFVRDGKDRIYEKTIDDKNVRIRVSKSSSEISKGLFSKILKQQLGISKEEFNS